MSENRTFDNISNASTAPLPLIDASIGVWGDENSFVTPVTVVSGLNDDGFPESDDESAGFLDPDSFRWHVLKPASGDRRLTVQIMNDYEAGLEDYQDGGAPYHDEWHHVRNRSTRESDHAGRSTVPGTHRRIVDSEDQRYALALTLDPIGMTSSESAQA
ncbi:MAG: hypothetical protein VW362_12980, partial [Candidatus Nanopelagicales bacterium]